jgi:hypothetical protein
MSAKRDGVERLDAPWINDALYEGIAENALPRDTTVEQYGDRVVALTRPGQRLWLVLSEGPDPDAYIAPIEQAATKDTAARIVWAIRTTDYERAGFALLAAKIMESTIHETAGYASVWSLRRSDALAAFAALHLAGVQLLRNDFPAEPLADEVDRIIAAGARVVVPRGGVLPATIEALPLDPVAPTE